VGTVAGCRIPGQVETDHRKNERAPRGIGAHIRDEWMGRKRGQTCALGGEGSGAPCLERGDSKSQETGGRGRVEVEVKATEKKKKGKDGVDMGLREKGKAV